MLVQRGITKLCCQEAQRTGYHLIGRLSSFDVFLYVLLGSLSGFGRLDSRTRGFHDDLEADAWFMSASGLTFAQNRG